MAKKLKMLLEEGVAALCGGVRGARQTAESAGSAVTSLASAVAKYTDEVNEALDRKQDKGADAAVTITITGWGSDSNANYPRYYDITAEGVTANDSADVVISPSSVGTATACGLCPVTETLAGKIRIRAVSVPSASIAAQYWVGKGV